jgi:hypothetical protein
MAAPIRSTHEFQERTRRIEGLVNALKAIPDAAARQCAEELVASVMDLHCAGLERTLEILANAGEPGASATRSLAEDELTGSLLVLHGLHPDDFETRIRRGLDQARQITRSHGAHLEVLAITPESVHVKISGASDRGLESALREALLESAPDADEIVIEAARPAEVRSGFVPLSSLQAVPAAASSE